MFGLRCANAPSGANRRRFRTPLALTAGLADKLAEWRGRLGQEGLALILALTLIAPLCAQASGYSFVVVLTDDQRFDTLWAMPRVTQEIVSRGVNFTEAIVTTPLCCPARASILSGGYYAKNTGVLSSLLPNGSAARFDDDVNLGRLLQQVGYRTAFVGKWMNGYVDIAPHVPPGWDKFVATWGIQEAVEGSSGETSELGDFVTLTEVRIKYETGHVLEFLDTVGDEPFFLELSVFQPHYPAYHAAEDADLFLDYIYRGRGFGEEDLSDKPDFILDSAGDFTSVLQTQEEEDEFHQDQLRALQSVDRAVGQIVDKLEAMGRLDKTVLIFASDNGLLWGEHQLYYKERPYEESIRVPFVIAVPDIAPREDDALVAFNLDMGATIFDLAGIDAGTDGLSLMPLLENSDAAWRTDLLIENFTEHLGYIWAGLRVDGPSGKWKYVEHTDGSVELYDLINDAYELENVAGNPAYESSVETFAERLSGLKGLIITNGRTIRHAMIGDDFSFTQEAWGGAKPYSWTVVDGELPQGLVLNASTGAISGVPEGPAGITQVQIQVQASSLATQRGEPQSFITMFTVNVLPAAVDEVAITSAVWVQTRKVLLIRATSSAGDDVTLTVEGYGDMTYREQNDVFVARFNGVLVPPETVTVTSSGGGEATARVRIR